MLRSVDKGGLSDVVPVVSILTQEVCSLVVVDLPVRRFDAAGGVETVVGAGGVVAACVACKAGGCGGARRIPGCWKLNLGDLPFPALCALKWSTQGWLSQPPRPIDSPWTAYGLTVSFSSNCARDVDSRMNLIPLRTTALG